MAQPGKRIRRFTPRKLPGAKPAGPAQKPKVDPLAHNRLLRYMEDYFEWMLVTGYSADTVTTRRQALRKFISWADERGLSDPREITAPMLERYQRHLFYYRKTDGAPLTLAMQSQYLTPLKTWFKWLCRARHVLANPAADLELPKRARRLPRAVPTAPEVEAILREADPETPQGLRDRAMLEVLYATGMRRKEVLGVALYDVDLKRGLVWVRQGKGGHERVVPLGERAGAWLDRYLIEARPQLLAADSEALFLTDYGEPMRPYYVAQKVKRYLRLAGFEQPGATHLLRHACATHMLEGGADIRYIQEMLGHANLQTTEIYTHVAIDKLIAVHKATHPSRLERRGDAPAPLAGPSLTAAAADATVGLLAALAEDDDADADEAEHGT